MCKPELAERDRVRIGVPPRLCPVRCFDYIPVLYGTQLCIGGVGRQFLVDLGIAILRDDDLGVPLCERFDVVLAISLDILRRRVHAARTQEHAADVLVIAVDHVLAADGDCRHALIVRDLADRLLHDGAALLGKCPEVLCLRITSREVSEDLNRSAQTIRIRLVRIRQARGSALLPAFPRRAAR